MTMFSVTTNRPVHGVSGIREPNPRCFDLGALFGRVERLEARRNAGRAGAVTSAPTHWDAELIEDGAEFEAAWTREIDAMIALRRFNSAPAEDAARSARGETARLAAKIELSRAMTLEGLKVKARAILWRRNGEPLEKVAAKDSACSAARRPS